MPQHDGVIAVGAGRHHVDRRADQLAHPLQIAARRSRQLIPGREALGALRPARKIFVDRFAALDLVGIEREHVTPFAVEHITHTGADGRQAVEHIELGDAQPRHAVDDDRPLERRNIQPATAARTPRHCAELLTHAGEVMPHAARLRGGQLRREGAAAHPGGVRLGNAQHIVQHAGADARSCRGRTGHAIARSHEGISTVVDVEQRALRPFKEQAITAQMGLMNQVAHVGQQGPHLLGGLEQLIHHHSCIERTGVQIILQNKIVQIEHFSKLGLQALRMLEVLQTDGAAGHLVFVSRPDALAGGADLAAAVVFAAHLARFVERHMGREHDWAGLADVQP